MDRQSVIEREVPHYRRWLHTVANSLMDPWHPDHDDLCQEGMIAMWRAVDTHDPERGPLSAWMVYRAAHRMKDVARERGNLTGAEGTRVPTGTTKGAEARERIRAYYAEHPEATGREVAAALGMSQATLSFHRKRLHDDREKPLPPTSLDALLDGGWDPTRAAETLDDVVTGYMDGRVAEALDELTTNERRYVTLRFWHGAEAADLREEFGYDPSGVWRTARRRLRPLLADLARKDRVA